MAGQTLPAVREPRVSGVLVLEDKPDFKRILEESGLTAVQQDLVVSKLEEVGIKHTSRSSFICCGDQCISRHICPFITEGKTNLLPLGKPCPIDTVIGQSYYHNILHDMQENQIEHTASTETIIRELVSIEIYVSRIDDYMSRSLLGGSGGDVRNSAPLTVDEPVPVNIKTGEVRYRIVEHPLVKTKASLEDRRTKLLQKLLLTPEVRVKMKIGAADSISKLLETQRKNVKEAIKNAKEHGGLTVEEIQKRAEERMHGEKPQHNDGI